MTEDKTFNALKRIPINQCLREGYLEGSQTPGFYIPFLQHWTPEVLDFMKARYWTELEFKREIAKIPELDLRMREALRIHILEVEAYNFVREIMG